jgi:hypothetical protein
LLFSASLGCLGVLGDMPFHRCFGALTLCTARPQEGIIAEDAEVTEARREKKKTESPARVERISSLGGEREWVGTGEKIGARITLIGT